MDRTDPLRRRVSVHRTFQNPFPRTATAAPRIADGMAGMRCAPISAGGARVRCGLAQVPLVRNVSAIGGIARAVAVLSTVRTCAPASASVPTILLSAASCARAALLFVHAARQILPRAAARHPAVARHPAAAQYLTAAWYPTAARHPTAALARCPAGPVTVARCIPLQPRATRYPTRHGIPA